MEHEARDVMARLAEHVGPPIGFTADEIAARGHRQARNHRIGAMVGSAAGVVGVVAVAATVSPASTGSGGGSGPLAPPTRVADPVCLADVAKSMPVNEVPDAAQRAVTLEACPLLRRMDAVLDPTGVHLKAVGSTLAPVPPDILSGFESVGKDVEYAGAMARSTWTPDGHNPSSPEHPTQLVGPFVDVQITVQPAGAPELDVSGTMDHLQHPELKPGQAPPAIPWSAPTTTELGDGSTVTVRSEHDSGGSSYLVTRTLRSGKRLMLEVSGVFNDNQDPTPFPFTEGQLVAAVSVPGLDDITFPPHAPRLLPGTSLQHVTSPTSVTTPEK